MEGLRLKGLRSASVLRKSALWEGPIKKQGGANSRADALQERLDELLVFEILRDGGQSFRNVTLRGLYKHVLGAITDREAAKVARQDMVQMSNRAMKSSAQIPTPELPMKTGLEPTMQSVLESPIPLGQAPTDYLMVQNENASKSPQPLRSVKPHRRTHSVGMGLLTKNDSDGVEEGGGAVTYRERLGGYLHPRDMRKLVTPFSSSNEPEIIVRRHVMLLNFDPLRAIILRDRLLVLVPDGADSILGGLEKKIRGSNEEFFDSKEENDGTGGQPPSEEKVRTSVFDKMFRKPFASFVGGDDKKNAWSSHGKQDDTKIPPAPLQDSSEPGNNGGVSETETDVVDDEDEEWDEMKGREWIDLPFELQCLDAVLQVVTEILSDDTFGLRDDVENYIQFNTGEDPLNIIRAVTDATREMTARVKGFEESLTRCLDEDEDMALMNLTRLLTHPEKFIQPVPAEVLEEESDEPELILEAHLQDAMSLSNILESLQGQIDSTSALLDRQLDATRNKLLVVNMLLTICTLCLTAISVAGSLFGMNLTNHLEDDQGVFLIVAVGSCVGAFLLGILIIIALVWSGTLPGYSSGPADK